MSAAKNVLVAEDSRHDFALLEAAFGAAGLPHRLFNVRDGAQALAYLRGEPPFWQRELCPFPYLLILDAKMPRGTGLEVLAYLRGRPELQVPVVMLTGSILP